MEYLGKGGFGKVVKAIWKESRDPIAIKFQKRSNEKDYERFLNEKSIMETLNEINCKNIVKYIDWEERNEMEFEITDKTTKKTEIQKYPAIILLMECGECNLHEMMQYRAKKRYYRIEETL